jgi:hypothetical protein
VRSPNESSTEVDANVEQREGVKVQLPGKPERQHAGDTRETERTTAAPLSLAKAGPWAVPLLLVILFVTFSVRAPHTFASVSNVRLMITGQGLQGWIADVLNGSCLMVAVGFSLLLRSATARPPA